MNKKFLLFLIPFFQVISVYSQTWPATWAELGFSKKIVKNLKAEFNPELRFLDSLKMDSYILEGGLSYKLHKYLTVAGYYRYEDEYDYKKKSGAYKGQKSLNRIAFDAKSGFDLNRVGFSFRVRYTKGLDSNNNDSEFRSRAKIEYDIKNSKLVPFTSVELFQTTSIKVIDKIRYTGGLSYSINKNNEVSLFYRLQVNNLKDVTTDILGLSYSFDF